MNRLFEIADYGVQYRSISKTGAILGSISDARQKSDETLEMKVPRWSRKEYSSNNNHKIHDHSGKIP